MGILTDPGMERSKFPALLHKYHKPLAVFLYLAGTVWVLLLAHNSLNHGTYFSENALLPGLVQGEFVGDNTAKTYFKSLKMEREKHSTDMPHAWLAAQFTQLGLDTYTHNFTLNYPMTEGRVFKGKNVYAILRAVRGSSTESLVVSAPYRPPTSLNEDTSASIALMLALANFFREQVYWAKDIIFLVTEHEQLGAQAWLEAYHRTQSGMGALNSGDLPARAGPIQAAVNLEIHNSVISHMDVKVEGLNGQLPNLDLVNLIHRLCHRENIRHTFQNRNDHPRPETFHGWMYQLKTLVSMITTQATGVPNGNHGLYHRFGIAAVTIEGIKDKGLSRKSASLLQLGRVLEGICRSLNNLLERFHQSFFFYLLPATNRYISIGVYMPPFGMIGGALLVIALALWYNTSFNAELLEKSNDPNANRYGVINCTSILVIVHLTSQLICQCPKTLASFGNELGLEPEDSIVIGLIAFSLSLLTLPRFFRGKENEGNSYDWQVLKCLSVLELSVFVFAGAVYNFSLALIVTLVYTPVTMFVTPSVSRITRILKSIMLILCHPLSLLYIFVSIDAYINFDMLPIDKLLLKSFSSTKHALMFSIVDSFIYSNWVFNAAVLCLLPIWLTYWSIIHHPIQT